MNLAVNARDAMPGGGVLAIETSNVTVDADFVAGGSGARPGRNVRLRVSDGGCGMPADVIEHAFDAFFTTKPAGAGTGLGLATVYGIIAQAGGHIQIYSEPGGHYLHYHAAGHYRGSDSRPRARASPAAVLGPVARILGSQRAPPESSGDSFEPVADGDPGVGDGDLVQRHRVRRGSAS